MNEHEIDVCLIPTWCFCI